jgi:prophage regulatory protein
MADFPYGDRFMQLREVEARSGLKHTAIYRKMASGDFPRARSLGPRTVRWLESEINQWIQSRPVTEPARKAG